MAWNAPCTEKAIKGFFRYAKHADLAQSQCYNSVTIDLSLRNSSEVAYLQIYILGKIKINLHLTGDITACVSTEKTTASKRYWSRALSNYKHHFFLIVMFIAFSSGPWWDMHFDSYCRDDEHRGHPHIKRTRGNYIFDNKPYIRAQFFSTHEGFYVMYLLYNIWIIFPLQFISAKKISNIGKKISPEVIPLEEFLVL